MTASAVALACALECQASISLRMPEIISAYCYDRHSRGNVRAAELIDKATACVDDEINTLVPWMLRSCAEECIEKREEQPK